jgi:hypothetical protein
MMPHQIKFSSIAYIVWLAVIWPSWADDRVVKFGDANKSITYDLSTAKLVGPGRFTIFKTIVDSPEVMKFELKVLDGLRAYCARPEGQYSVPQEFFTLGPPDMPVEPVEVRISRANQSKWVDWFYPYKRLAKMTPRGLEKFTGPGIYCVGSSEDKQEYLKDRRDIVSGFRVEALFDYRRGIMGFPTTKDDPAETRTPNVKGESLREYLSVCQKVTHERPIVPE